MEIKNITGRIKGSLKVLFGQLNTFNVNTDNVSDEKLHFCPVCNQKVECFKRLPSMYDEKQDEVGYIHPVCQIETLNRFAYSCPNCGSSDRERLYALYFNNFYNNFDSDISLLDIAPAKPLQQFIKKSFINIRYRSVDLSMEEVDDKADITNLKIYHKNSFDFFICSHVLEHIENDRKAIQELFRITKPGGKGIAMVPILLNLDEDYERPEITAPDDRWKHFGQDDHVRVYSKPGFITKLTDSGFFVNQFGIDAFGGKQFQQCGIHKRSILYIVEK